MTHHAFRAAVLSGLLLTGLACGSPPKKAAPEVRRIPRAVLEDKIRGGWAGQMIGVSFGAPTEFKAQGKILEGDLPWAPGRVENSIHQDDLYVEMTFAEVMDKKGLDALSKDYGEMFKDSKYGLWHANAAARRILSGGIEAPLSGDPKYNIHANDIDFQIEADFIGLMTPGLPQESNRLCDRVGRVMNSGDGLYGGMFCCGMYAAAFFESDIRKVVEQGLACIPAESRYGKLVRDVLGFSATYPDDWRKTWQEIQYKWDKDDSCPDGALQSFNIDACLNGAYIAIGLLYGKGDLAKTLEISTRCGQDSDCNPASAAGILGVLKGYAAIPEEYTSGIAAIADTKFEYTSYSFNEIVRSTLVRAVKVVENAGGRVMGDQVVVPIQAPAAPALEQWSMGIPEKSMAASDGDWAWSGAWSDSKDGKSASGAGAEATLRFSGTAVAVVGSMTQEGGKADVLIDGKKVGGINAYIPPNTHDNDLFHAYGLADGDHELKILMQDDADPRSKGKKVVISRAISYRGK